MTEKTSAELQQEAEIARAKVSDTAESIRNKMTPGQLIDEFSGMFTGDGSVLTTLKTQVQANPIPAALVGVGLAWLMAGPRSRPATTAPRRPYSPGTPSDTYGTESYGSGSYGSDSDRSSRSQGAGLMSSVKDSAASLASTASSFVGNAASAIASKTSGAAHGISDAAHGISDQASGYASTTSNQAARVASATTDMLRQEPMVLAAVGLAIGTAIGALLPRTEIEDEQVGELSDKLRGQASDLLHQGVEGAKDVAAQAYQTVKDEADKRVGAEDGSLVDQVKEVVKATAAQTETNVREKLKTVTGEPKDESAASTDSNWAVNR